MAGITSTLIEYHRHCEGYFAAIAEPIGTGDWSAARDALQRYRQAIDRLVQMEEGVLFPAFERETGKDQGPTRVLRFDHSQLRHLLGELEAAVERGDAEASASLRSRMSVTLHEHWLREERLMLPMLEEVLAGEAGRLVEQLRCIAET
jgi:hemerythrin-like domain-containing protein